MTARFALVDVFHDGAFTGNPLAVVSGADLDTATMQAMTRWFNLSETAFLLPPTDPGADYRSASSPSRTNCPSPAIRRSAPAMPGSPSAAGRARTGASSSNAAPAWCRSGRTGTVSPSRRRGCSARGRWMRRRCGTSWRCCASTVSRSSRHAGPITARLGRGDAALRRGGAGGRAGPPPRGPDRYRPRRRPSSGAEAAWEIRTLFSDGAGALVEDPVTGSFNAAVAGLAARDGRAAGPYIAPKGRSSVGAAGSSSITTAPTGSAGAPSRWRRARSRAPPDRASGQAAFTPDRDWANRWVWAEVWRPRSWAMCSIEVAASPVAPTSLRTSLMFPETDRDPVAACWTLWAISRSPRPARASPPSCRRGGVAQCVIVVPISPIAETALPVAWRFSATCAPISSVARPSGPRGPSPPRRPPQSPCRLHRHGPPRSSR